VQKTINNILPILAVEHNCIISKAMDITIVYKVQLPEMGTLSGEQHEGLHQAWIKAINALPAGMILHKQDWFFNAYYSANFYDKENSFLSHASEKHFNERGYMEHDSYLMLTKRSPAKKISTSAINTLVRPSPVPKEILQPSWLESLEEIARQFQTILSESGLIRLDRLKNDGLASNENSIGFIEKYCTLNYQANANKLADISFGDPIMIADQHCIIFSLSDAADLPAYVGCRIDNDNYSTDSTKFPMSFAASLGHALDVDHIYNLCIFIDDTQAEMKKLESKKLRLQSLSAYSRENAIARESVNEYLNESISLGRRPVKMHAGLLVSATSPGDLKIAKTKAAAALAKLGATAKIESIGAPQIWWAGMPGNEADFPMNETFHCFAQQATCWCYNETAYRSSNSPFGIRLGERLSGRPVHVDLSDEPMLRGICTNRNKFILGPSGSGKSFFTNHMLRAYYEQGTHIVLVDVGHSYKGLCDLVGGYYFTYSETSPVKFNPFYGELDTEKKESIKTLLLALWKKDDEVYTRAEYIALSNALEGYYAALEGFACFNSFYEYLSGSYVTLLRTQKVKEKDFDIDNLLYVLRPYYKGGELDYLLNADTDLDMLDQPFIVFELDNIKDHPILFPVVTIIIMEVFISKMRKLKGIRKMILIEEAWKAIAKEGMAEYIKYLFKTVRKYFGEAVVVTQEVEDIISSPVVKQAIINNSDCKILLDQSKYENKFDLVQQLLGLTDKEKAQVLSVNRSNDPSKKYKEVFISLGGQYSKVYRVEVSPEEYYAYTTEEKEKMKVNQYADRYGGIEKGISILVNELK
jgi:conjugation system TraG family ATPase